MRIAIPGASPYHSMRHAVIAQLALLLPVIFMAISSACAQTWPAKPVRMICSVAAGTAPDLVLRMAAERLSKNTGKQFFVENILGGE